jgi:hypothetical protein
MNKSSMRNNSRMGRVLPDVPPVDLPLVTVMVAATDAFGAGRMGVVAFQAAILDLLRADPPAARWRPGSNRRWPSSATRCWRAGPSRA